MIALRTKKVEEIKIPVPWGHISGKWWGPRDRDPVIAIHGWQDNAGTFDNLAPLLPEDLALLCIDLPGHGLSSHFPPGQFYYIWWDNLLVLRRVVLYLRLKRISLIGHSLGGGIGFLYAAIYPDEVDKLVSIDIVCPRVESPDTIADNSKMCIERFLKYDSTPADTVPCYNEVFMLETLEDAHKGSITRSNCEILMKRGIKSSPKDSKLYYFSRDTRLKVAGLASLSKDQVLAFAEKIKCEYLNIQADNGLVFTYPELNQQILDIIKAKSPRFEVHRVPGTHHVHLEDAPVVSNVISSFLTVEKGIPMSQNHEDLII